jgi:hypothetical protein
VCVGWSRDYKILACVVLLPHIREAKKRFVLLFWNFF